MIQPGTLCYIKPESWEDEYGRPIAPGSSVCTVLGPASTWTDCDYDVQLPNGEVWETQERHLIPIAPPPSFARLAARVES